MDKKLVVISLDALQAGDLDYLGQLPYFSQILGNCALVRNVREVYPTLTYPIHTTMITGAYPEDHGIYHNQKSSISPRDPDFNIMGSDWYWDKEHIRVKTLVDAVWEAGGSAATVLWPVTAGDARGYNLPEIWPVRDAEGTPQGEGPQGANSQGKGPRELYHRAASPLVMEEYYDRFIARYNWADNEDMCHYGVEIALDILRRKQPDLLLCHVVHLDHARHEKGNQGPHIQECLRQLDIILGRFLRAAEEAGVRDQTNFVVLGDHGQIDIDCLFHLNRAFADAGLIHLNRQGKPTGYDAYCFSAGFSAHVILGDPWNRKLYRRVRDLLDGLAERYPQYISRIYSADEARREEHLAGEFSFVVEASQGVLLMDGPDRDLIVPRESPGYYAYAATHGHHPSKGGKPPFLAFGPDVQPGVTLESGEMIQVCPTLSKLLGVEMNLSHQPFPVFRGKEQALFLDFSLPAARV